MKRFQFKNFMSVTLSLAVVLTTAGAPGLQVASTSAESTTAADTTGQEGGELIKDVFGEITFYRWDRVTEKNYPIDTEWHPSLLIWGKDSGKKDDGYISALAPNDIYLGPTAKPVEGVTNRFTKDNPIYKNQFKDDEYIDEEESHYIRVTDRGEGLDIGSDPQIKADKDTFYTSDDRDCLYVKYGKRDKDNNGLDGYHCPVYMIKMSKATGVQKDYYLEPYGQGDDSGLKIRNDAYGYEWSFKSSKNAYRGVVWRVFYNKDDEDDPHLSIGGGKRIVHCTSDEGENDKMKWYIGTPLRYSAIKGDVTVKSGQILSISASDYVDAKGNAASQQGVVLPSGRTVTIEKGGILSISGDFINNGTIVNNGGTVIVQKGGTIFPFLQGTNYATQGCGSIKCNGGDIIIEKGGAVYAGFNCAVGSTPGVSGLSAFWMNNSSTMVNYGLLCCGFLRIGESSTIENRVDGRIYTCMFEPNFGTFSDMLKDNTKKLSSGSTSGLQGLSTKQVSSQEVLVGLGVSSSSYSPPNSTDYFGGITTLDISGSRSGQQNNGIPIVFLIEKQKNNLYNPSSAWKKYYIKKGYIRVGKLEL